MHTLTEPELCIMQVFWETDEAVPRLYIQEKLSHLGWKTNTFNTYLSRLLEKGFLMSESRGQTYFYRPAVKKEEYQKKEGSSVLAGLFDGSLRNLVVSLSSTDAVDESDLDELRTYLDEMKGGGKNE